jgi:alanine racemase
VATVGEGRQLRQRGIQAPILVLSPIATAEASTAIDLGLELTIATEELLAAVAGASRTAAAPIGVHVKLDSGMHRYGAEPALALTLAKRVASTPSLRLAGFMTHFAAADETDDRFTIEQASLYDHCVAELAALGIRPERRHMANSAAALRDRRYDADLVRFGIAMYGLRPSSAIALPSGVRPVLTVRSAIGRIHRLEPPSTIGYGRTYTPAKDEQVGLVPIGYADGYRRSLSNKSWMTIGGRPAPIIGRISMDQTVIRLPADLVVNSGDDVLVFGGTAGGPSVDEIASQLGTINYEVVTGLAARVPRHYLRDGRVVAVESQLPA